MEVRNAFATGNSDEDIARDIERLKRIATPKLNKETIFGTTLHDILTIRNWMCYAKLIGDKSYKMISEDKFVSPFLEKKLSKKLH